MIKVDVHEKDYWNTDGIWLNTVSVVPRGHVESKQGPKKCKMWMWTRNISVYVLLLCYAFLWMLVWCNKLLLLVTTTSVKCQWWKDNFIYWLPELITWIIVHSLCQLIHRFFFKTVRFAWDARCLKSLCWNFSMFSQNHDVSVFEARTCIQISEYGKKSCDIWRNLVPGLRN